MIQDIISATLLKTGNQSVSEPVHVEVAYDEEFDPLAIMMTWFAGIHDPATWAILGGLALAGGLAQLTLTGALRLAPVALVMPMDYTSLIWAMLFGMWIFGEMPTPWIWAGAPIIIASGLVIAWREHRLARQAALSAATAAPN